MKRLNKLIVLLVVFSGAGHVLADGLAKGDAQAGKAKAAMCAACHGPDGNSTSPMYPKLAGQGSLYLEKQLHDFKSGKRSNPIMSAMAAGLSDQDIANLATYFSDQTTSPGEADPKLVKQGEQIFRGGIQSKGVPACSGCHGPAGQGIISAKYPKLAGQHAQYIVAQLEAFRAAGRDDLQGTKRTNDRTSDAPGPMETIASRLSDEEIEQVASFVSGLSK